MACWEGVRGELDEEGMRFLDGVDVNYRVLSEQELMVWAPLWLAVDLAEESNDSVWASQAELVISYYFSHFHWMMWMRLRFHSSLNWCTGALLGLGRGVGQTSRQYAAELGDTVGQVPASALSQSLTCPLDQTQSLHCLALQAPSSSSPLEFSLPLWLEPRLVQPLTS